MFPGIISRPVEWLLNGGTAMAAIVTANIWIGIPFNMILILTGLTTIPADIYESANIDGASKLRQLFAITIPMIKPAIMSVLTLGFVYTFKVFDLAWVMTKGGPVNATQLVSTYAYRLSFEELLFSRGAASANVLFIILLVMGFFYIRTIDDSEVM
jgi:multiple sugar transport system permease protein